MTKNFSLVKTPHLNSNFLSKYKWTFYTSECSFEEMTHGCMFFDGKSTFELTDGRYRCSEFENVRVYKTYRYKEQFVRSLNLRKHVNRFVGRNCILTCCEFRLYKKYRSMDVATFHKDAVFVRSISILKGYGTEFLDKVGEIKKVDVGETLIFCGKDYTRFGRHRDPLYHRMPHFEDERQLIVCDWRNI